MSIMEPLVSIIIPVYNIIPYLDECIESVIRQTYSKIEIILIDDGSTDGSQLICDQYSAQDKRVKVFHQENHGLSSARNIGLEHMSGSVVAFIDPDDVMSPTMIELVIQTMRAKGVEILAFGCERYQGGRIISEPEDGYYDQKHVISSYVSTKGITSAIWTKVFNSSLFDDIRFREGHNYADMEVFLKALSKTKTMYAIHHSLIRYRKRNDSITYTNTPDNVLDCWEQNNWIIEYTKGIKSKRTAEALLSRGINIMLGGYCALYNNMDAKSLSIKAFFSDEIESDRRKISWRFFLIKSGALVFHISENMYVWLHKIYHESKRRLNV